MYTETLIMLLAVLLGFLYLGTPKFLSNLSVNPLGRLLLLSFVYLVSVYHGINAGLLSALLVVFLMSNREGFEGKDDKEDSDKEDSDKKDSDKEDSDKEDSDKEDDGDDIIDCGKDKDNKDCKKCDAKHPFYSKKHKKCLSQAELKDLDRELKKGKQSGDTAVVNGTEDIKPNQPVGASPSMGSMIAEGFANYH